MVKVILKKNTHGTWNCYANGCRCQPCKEAETERSKRYQKVKSNKARYGKFHSLSEIIDYLKHAVHCFDHACEECIEIETILESLDA